MLRQANCVLALAPYLGADLYHHANFFFFRKKWQADFLLMKCYLCSDICTMHCNKNGSFFVLDILH